MLAPRPGSTIEVSARELALPGVLAVAICVDSSSRLARCADTGRLLAVLAAGDSVLVAHDGALHSIAAAHTSLPTAGRELDVVCDAPRDLRPAAHAPHA